jgi:hypothetical protein
MITQTPFFELAQGEVAFTAEPHWPAAAKQQLWQDWRRFVYGGFRRVLFTPELYQFLYGQCGFIAHYNADAFWTYYFNGEVLYLRAFLNQFGGNRQSAEYGTITWLDGPAGDLKAAMCEEVTFLYAPLSQVLQDLETKHEELARAWCDFALSCGLQADNYPAHYLVGENTRNLLAYAADIARQRPQPPLRGLQLCLSPYLLGATRVEQPLAVVA